jgi:2-keto-myo-inositol isomerase
MDFELCLNTSTIQPASLIDKIRLTAAAGFTAIEPWINDVYEYVGQGGEVRDVERALADCGLRIPCAIALRGWGEAIAEEYPVMLDECRRRMELAARLGAPYIVATPPRVACERKQITDRYGDLLDIGRRAGIRPVMEYISFFKSVWRLDQAWQIVRDVGDDDAMLVLDAFHSFNSGCTLDDLRAVDGRRIAHYHINDAAPDKPPGEQTDPDRSMPGDGPIDLKAELTVLREKGYRGALSLELFNAQLWSQDPAEVLRMGVERIRRLMDG